MKTINININEKEYPFMWGSAASRRLAKKSNLRNNQLFGKYKEIDTEIAANKLSFESIDFICNIILAGIEHGLHRTKQPTDHGLTIEDVYDLVDDNPDEITKAFNVIPKK